MSRKAKIAVSLAPEVLELVDRNARGRSRSRCIEEELLRALRAREWERLSAQIESQDAEEQIEWADAAFGAAHDALARDEGEPHRRGARRGRVRR
jgi:hypothetical protein